MPSDDGDGMGRLILFTMGSCSMIWTVKLPQVTRKPPLNETRALISFPRTWSVTIVMWVRKKVEVKVAMWVVVKVKMDCHLLLLLAIPIFLPG